MNYPKVRSFFEIISKVSAVVTAAAIVLSTSATVILFPTTVVLSFIAGNLREKFSLIINNPTTLVFLCFYAMFLIGITHSVASWSDILLMLRKYDKFFLAVMFLPLFTEERWRNYAINAFLMAILILLISSYLRSYGWLHFKAYGSVEVFKHSIEYNFLLAFAAYLCLIKMLSAGASWRWVLGVFLGLIAYTVLFRSVGRSGYIVFAALMGLFFTQKFGWRGLLICIVSIMLLSGLAFKFSQTFQGRTQVAFKEFQTHHQLYRAANTSVDNTSVGLRMTFVEDGINLIKSHPFVGTGTGSYRTALTKIKDNFLGVGSNPHNEYIYITVQFGIVGLIILLLFFTIPLGYSTFLPEQSKYIARGAVIAIMLGSLANSWLLDITEGYFYAYFIMLAFAALPKEYYLFKSKK